MMSLGEIRVNQPLQGRFKNASNLCYEQVCLLYVICVQPYVQPSPSETATGLKIIALNCAALAT